MHVQTNLLYGVGDVRLCERQVLESSCNAPELRGILDRGPRVPNQVCLEVNWSRAQPVVRHDRTLHDVERVGVLVEEQPIWMMLDGDAEEVVKRPEVLHGEFPLKSRNGTT
jgi:hypothetical protein